MANYDYVTSQGVVIVDTATLLNDVQTEWKDALGNDLIVTPDTPQGVMIVSETSSRVSVLNALAYVVNQINPNEASGIFCDALCGLMMLEREGASYSTISGVTVTGTPGAFLDAGSQATMSLTGDAFVTTTAVTFNSSGNATVDFRAVNTGPVACPSGELDTVGYVQGWETVSNSAAAVLGNDKQSDAALMSKRKDTLGRQGMSTPEAQISALYDVPGVFSVSYRDNSVNTTTTIDGISLVAHSVWACVNGGSDLAIATALLENKTDGANWNGAHSLSVLDPISGQSYLVKWDRPTLIPVLVKVTVRKNSDPSNPTVVIPQSVVDYASGLIPYLGGFKNGAAVSPFEIAKAVGYRNPLFTVDKVEVALVSTGTFQTTEITTAINEAATVTLGNVSVVVL